MGKEGHQTTISGRDFKVVFDLVQGSLISYAIGNDNLISNGPTPSFWRAPTDNDIGAGYNSKLRPWRLAFKEGKVVKAEVRVDGTDYLVTVVKDLLKGDAQSIISYYIHPDGSMDVKNNFKAIKGSHKLLMRAGNNLELDKSLQQIAFYGRGPGENYWDRKSASLVGLFKQTLDEQYFPYARPQESGNKSDIRWVSLTDKNGKGIKFAFVDSLLNFSALPYSLDDLDPEVEKKQYHSGELEPRDKIYMHLDLNQIGLQGIDSWGSQPLEQYRIPFDDFFYSYRIIPLK